MFYDEIERLKDDILKVEENNKILQDNDREKSDRMKKFLEKNLALEKEIEVLQAEVTNLKAGIEDRDKNIIEQTVTIKELSIENESLREEVKALQGKLDERVLPVNVKFPNEAIKLRTTEAMKALSSLQRFMENTSLSLISTRVTLDRLSDVIPGVSEDGYSYYENDDQNDV